MFHMDIDALTTRELQKILRERGLPYGYRRKMDLVKRLKDSVKSKKKEFEDSDGDTITDDGEVEEESEIETDAINQPVNEVKNDAVSDADGNVSRKKSLSKQNERHVNQFAFKDVEDALTCFDGESEKNIADWFEEFEEVATVCNWSSIQKYLYARKLLKGAARMAIQAESDIINWKTLRRYLLQEFDDLPRSIDVHKCLQSQKQEKGQSLLAYLYSMKKIAAQGNVDEASLVAYVIAGIQDDSSNKIVLYGARNCEELKRKFKTYQEILDNHQKKRHDLNVVKKNPFASKPNNQNGSNRCFNCGGHNHLSRNCPDKLKGTRCFKCGNFGHLAPNCKMSSATGPSKDVNPFSVNTVTIPDMHVNILVENRWWPALLDTGSDVTLIRSSVMKKIKNPLSIDKGIIISGLGQKAKMTICSLTIDMTINGHAFVVKCHVVPDSWLIEDILIGRDVLTSTRVLIENGKVSISRVENDRDERAEDDENFIWNIETINCDDELECVQEVADPKMRTKIAALVQNYKPEAIPKTKMEMRLTLTDETPIIHRPRRLAPAERQIVQEQIQTWLENEIVKPSCSEFASPVVLAKKKNGSYRLCIDFRRINKKICRDRYPLPIIEDILEKLYDADVFSVLDLKNGFFHVDVHADSQKYTSFVVENGQFEFLKVPFGLSNSPSVFQRFVNTIFRDLINQEIVMIYMDDLIIATKDETKNIENVTKVLEVAQKEGLIINWNKCQFLKRKIRYLGHIIENGSIRPSDEKTKAVHGFPKPKKLKELRSFLGLTGYFRKFVPNYSLIAKPLTDLLKKNITFEFGPVEDAAFMTLKDKLCSEPVLKLFNPELVTELHTDASIDGYGAVLLQNHQNCFHPVFYLSFKTTEQERKYCSYDLEVLAIIRSLEKLRIYLLGIDFKIVTDCRAFHLTMKKKELCCRVARWAMALEEFSCVVQHRSGSSMKHVDALSRHPVVLNVKAEVIHQMKRAQQNDENCQLIIKILESGQVFKDFSIRNEILYKFEEGSNLLVVPKRMQNDIIKDIHERGHLSRRRVEAAVKMDYYIPKLGKKIANIIDNCVSCILSANKTGKQEGLLNPIMKPDVPFNTYHLDHLGPLPSTAKTYKYLLVVVDAFTKFVWIYPTKSTSSEEVLQKLQFQSSLFGNPYRIITDRGAAFTSTQFKDYCVSEAIGHVLVTTGVPRGNGQVERINRTIISVLSKMTSDNPMKWYKFVPDLQRTLNSSICRSTNRTPFELMVGVPMHSRNDVSLTAMIEDSMVDELDENRNMMRADARKQIEKVREENRRTFNKRRKKARRYNLQELVAIRRTQFGPGLKLFPKYLGPYEVTSVKRNDRYAVKKIGEHEGPNITSSSADNMKPWSNHLSGDSEEDMSSGSDDPQDGRL